MPTPLARSARRRLRYTTAKKLAQQLRHSAIVALLAKSFAEEENAECCLTRQHAAV